MTWVSPHPAKCGVQRTDSRCNYLPWDWYKMAHSGKEKLLKILVIGDFAVGKPNLFVNRWALLSYCRFPTVPVGLWSMFVNLTMPVGLWSMFVNPTMPVGLWSMFVNPTMSVGLRSMFVMKGTSQIIQFLLSLSNHLPFFPIEPNFYFLMFIDSQQRCSTGKVSLDHVLDWNSC